MNVIKCFQAVLLWLPDGTAFDSNFIDNELRDYLIFGSLGVVYLKNCAFFGNSNKDDSGRTSYVSCIGDISRSGVTLQPQTKTLFLTYIDNAHCAFSRFVVSRKKFECKLLRVVFFFAGILQNAIYRQFSYSFV